MTRLYTLTLCVLLAGCGAETPDIDARGVCRSELLRSEPYPKHHPCYIAPSDDNDGLTHDTAWETIGGPHPNAGNEKAPRFIRGKE